MGASLRCVDHDPPPLLSDEQLAQYQAEMLRSEIEAARPQKPPPAADEEK